MRVTAIGRNVGSAPRKVELLVRELPGKTIDDASTLLRFSGKPVAKAVDKVLQSAAANAENNYAMDRDNLKVVAAWVGKGRTLKRFKARSRGRVSPILRRSCHVTVVVDEV
jgi:large subunit ribosomal protein L22